jgi:hypothetical protein
MVLITVPSPHSSHCRTPVQRFRSLYITTGIASSTVHKLAFLSCRENKQLLLNSGGCCSHRFRFIEAVLFHIYFLMIPAMAANLLKFASWSYFLRKQDKTRAKSPSASKMPEGLWVRLDAIRMFHVNTKSMWTGLFLWPFVQVQSGH